MIHDLKCWPEYFQAVKSGAKPFELRRDDRGFAVGDILHLREFDPDTALYMGDEIDKTVTYVLPVVTYGAGNDERYVIMGLASRDWTPCAEGLPKEYGTYWVAVDPSTVVTGDHPYEVYACYFGKELGWETTRFYHKVVAWKPKNGNQSPWSADDTTGKVKEDADKAAQLEAQKRDRMPKPDMAKAGLGGFIKM